MENQADGVNQACREFFKVNAPVASALHKLETATREGNVLDAKTHELISLAVAVTTRCDGCIAAHAAAAKKSGASKEEIAAALVRRIDECGGSICLLVSRP